MKRKSLLIESLTNKMLDAHAVILDYRIQQTPILASNYSRMITQEELLEAKDLFNVTKRKLINLLI